MTSVLEIIAKARTCKVDREILEQIIDETVETAIQYGMMQAIDPDIRLVRSSAVDFVHKNNVKKLRNALNIIFGSRNG